MTEDDLRHGSAAGYSAHRRSKTSVCEPCRLAHNTAKRQWKRQPEGDCLTCTRKTTAVDKVCRSCRHREEVACRDVSDSFALRGGRWVPSDGIMRWVAA